MVNVGVIGCGHWGPNHIRIFSQRTDSAVLMCADLDEGRLKAIKVNYPNIGTTMDYKEILNNPAIDAVCIASPTKIHYDIACESLECDKHVLCEKPLALSVKECDDLNKLADKHNKYLMVGHVFLFNSAIKWLKSYIQSGELGKVHYAYCTRTNLGPFRYDVNALWDLAPHDISIFNYLFDSRPIGVSARGHKCLGNSLEDLTFATIDYPDNIMVNVHVSWIDPKKVRQMTIVGDKKMVIWNDMDNVGPIKLYDKHVEKTSTYYQTYGEFQLLSKEGSITIPRINFTEPLKDQADYFVQCITHNQPPVLTDGHKGRDVVDVLCSIQKSVNKKGAYVKMQEGA